MVYLSWKLIIYIEIKSLRRRHKLLTRTLLTILKVLFKSRSNLKVETVIEYSLASFLT